MILLAVALLFLCTSPALASTCYGDNPCHACHTCEHCRHCNSGGNPCGVIAGTRVTKVHTARTKSRASHASASAIVLPSSFKPQKRSRLSTVTGQRSRLSSFHRPADNAANPIPVPLQSLPEPSPLPIGHSSLSLPPSEQLNQSYGPGREIPLSSALAPVVSGPPRVWQLSVTPMALNGMTESLVGFHHWTDMQLESRIVNWDKWATHILHTVYSSLSSQTSTETSGRFESFVIYIRSDQKIMLRDTEGNDSANIAQLRSVVEQLNGSPALVFPHPVRDDTVFISGMIGYAPERVALDVWGRPEVKEVSNWNRRSW